MRDEHLHIMITSRCNGLINVFLKAGEALIKTKQLRNREVFFSKFIRPRYTAVPGISRHLALATSNFLVPEAMMRPGPCRGNRALHHGFDATRRHPDAHINMDDIS